jgi:hypothetical protein
LDAFARNTLQCDWVSASNWSGSCRKLLRTDGSRAEGRLSLAPLVWMLHSEGAREVRIAVDSAGHPDTGASGSWQKLTIGGGSWYRGETRVLCVRLARRPGVPSRLHGRNGRALEPGPRHHADRVRPFRSGFGGIVAEAPR